MGWDSNKYPSNWNSIRKRVLRRDNYQCTKCGTDDDQMHVHHITPVSDGGSHEPRNLRTLCHSCHESVHGHRIPTKSKSSSSGFSWTALGIQNFDNYFDVEESQDEEIGSVFERSNCVSTSDWIGRIVGVIVATCFFFSPTYIWISYHGLSGIGYGLIGLSLLMLIIGIPWVIVTTVVFVIAWWTAALFIAGLFWLWEKIHPETYRELMKQLGEVDSKKSAEDQ